MAHLKKFKDGFRPGWVFSGCSRAATTSFTSSRERAGGWPRRDARLTDFVIEWPKRCSL